MSARPRRVAVADGVAHIVVECGDIDVSLVRQFDTHPGAERHRHDAVEASAFGAREQGGLEGRGLSKPEAEEIAERRAHGRSCRAVPVDIEPKAAQGARAAAGDAGRDCRIEKRHPNPADGASSRAGLGQHHALPRVKRDRGSTLAAAAGLSCL
jgi:hypothetical protein